MMFAIYTAFFLEPNFWVEPLKKNCPSIYEVFWAGEVKQPLNPPEPSSVPSSIQTEQTYILKRVKTRKKIKTEKHFNN
jgi:hypothetical protein